jgi:hypothetical protein
MPEAPNPQPPDRITATAHLVEDPDTFFAVAIVTVTRPEEIPAALAQGKPVLIDIPAVQWRLKLLATILKWGGMWLVGFLTHWWLGHWLDAQLPNKDYLVPDWAKFHLEPRQPDNKVILRPHIPSPHEE